MYASQCIEAGLCCMHVKKQNDGVHTDIGHEQLVAVAGWPPT